jgi:hypothetical protein
VKPAGFFSGPPLKIQLVRGFQAFFFINLYKCVEMLQPVNALKIIGNNLPAG